MNQVELELMVEDIMRAARAHVAQRGFKSQEYLRQVVIGALIRAYTAGSDTAFQKTREVLGDQAIGRVLDLKA